MLLFEKELKLFFKAGPLQKRKDTAESVCSQEQNSKF
jgi:hypothetical protein